MIEFNWNARCRQFFSRAYDVQKWAWLSDGFKIRSTDLMSFDLMEKGSIEIDFAVEYPIDYTYRKRERERWRNTWKVTTQWLSVHSSFQSKCTLKCFLDVFLLIWKCFSIRGISFWVLNPLWRYVKKSARMILVLHAFVFFEKSNAWRLEFKNKQIIWVNNLLVIFFFYEFLCHVQWKSMSTY